MESLQVGLRRFGPGSKRSQARHLHGNATVATAVARGLREAGQLMITPILLAVLAWSARRSITSGCEAGPGRGVVRAVMGDPAEGGTASRQAALIRRGGDSGPAIEPGDSGESLLIERVTAEGPGADAAGERGDAAEPGRGGRLAGLDRPGRARTARADPPDPRRHWAFQPPARPAIPRTVNTGWSHNPVDAFLDAAHRARRSEAGPARRQGLWMRRLTLDLIGLPPTRRGTPRLPRQSTPDACGEGRRPAPGQPSIWRALGPPLDGRLAVQRLVWTGSGGPLQSPHIWHWRDWIVASLNADKGYDRMVMEMLAGDELAPDDPDTIRASGFLVRNWDIFKRNVWLASTVEHTARASSA